MNPLEIRLQTLNPSLYGKFLETVNCISLLLGKYDHNFEEYTDHSANHTLQVFKLASQLMYDTEIDNLNADEIYILSMSCLLHDVGMCIPEKKLIQLFESSTYEDYRASHPNQKVQDSIRDVHHQLSYDFILQEWEDLFIPNYNYAKAIALVSLGHRKVKLDDIDVYNPKHFVKDGREFVCLPYLACILRIADELDITNIRTPKLLLKYYMPENEKSIREWKKHIATTQINFTDDKVIFEVTCSDQNNLAALENQFEKIQDVLNYCQKTIRNISNTENRKFSLKLREVNPKYKFDGFDPKGIKFSFNVAKVIDTFIGHNLYDNELTAIREVIQNAIDSCRYRMSLDESKYSPKIQIIISKNNITVKDNGLGMDEFVVQNFFGKLGNSFYTKENIIGNFEAIGQFGIGVFSYFLLSDFVLVESKSKNGKPLKFLIDKDPKNYFHFYDKTSFKDQGTSVSLELKEQIKSKFKVSDYFDYITTTFRHLEFPLSIVNENNTLELHASPIEVAADQLISSSINFKYSIEDYSYLTHKIENDHFEGECCLVIPKDISSDSGQRLEYIFSFEKEDYVGLGGSESIIDVSQKGVFISAYSSPSLNLVQGNVNLKRKLNLNINRHSFTNSNEIVSVLNEFAVELGRKFLKNYSVSSDEHKLKLTRFFLHEYLVNARYIDEFSELLYFTLRVTENTSIIDLKNILTNYQEFVLIESDFINHFTIKDIPILSAGSQDSNTYHQSEFSILLRYFKSFNRFSVSIISEDNRIFRKISQRKVGSEQSIELEFYSVYVQDFCEFDNNWVAAIPLLNIDLNKHERDILSNQLVCNSNHPFNKFVKSIDYTNTLYGSSEIHQRIEESFSLIHLITIGVNEKSRLERIKELNALISPIKELSYSFEYSDFQLNLRNDKEIKK